MVVGNGLIASKFITQFEERNDLIIFASGVSNSKEYKETAFKREYDLLKNQIGIANKIVYFSTTSIYDEELSNSPYVVHKKNMEAFIKRYFPKYLIIRASNIIGPGGNKATIINYLYHKVKNKERFDLWVKAKRNLLDIDDFAFIVKTIINRNEWNKTIDVNNFKSMTMEEILHKIEKHLNTTATFTPLLQGGNVHINQTYLTKILPTDFIAKLKADNYLDLILKKYYNNG